MADRTAVADREPGIGARGVGARDRRVVARAEALIVPGRQSAAVLAPQDGRPPAGHARGSRAVDDGTVRPGAGPVCRAQRDGGWTERRRAHRRNAEVATLDARAARRAVRLDARPAERRRSDRQDLLQALCAGPHCAYVGYGDDLRSTADADVYDARTARRIPSAAAGAI